MELLDGCDRMKRKCQRDIKGPHLSWICLVVEVAWMLTWMQTWKDCSAKEYNFIKTESEVYQGWSNFGKVSANSLLISCQLTCFLPLHPDPELMQNHDGSLAPKLVGSSTLPRLTRWDDTEQKLIPGI